MSARPRRRGTATRRTGTGWSYGPATRVAALDVVDPGGHRMVQAIRQIDVPHDDGMQLLEKTIGQRVLFEVEGDPLERLWFACKVCRDQHRPFEFSVDATELEHDLSELLALCRIDETPRRREYRIKAVPTA